MVVAPEKLVLREGRGVSMRSFLGNSKVDSGILQNGVSLGESSTKGRCST